MKIQKSTRLEVIIGPPARGGASVTLRWGDGVTELDRTGFRMHVTDAPLQFETVDELIEALKSFREAIRREMDAAARGR
jgi:hypothetical protein